MLNHNIAWSGGTFYRAYHFARAMGKFGHEVTLMTISPKKMFGITEYQKNNVNFVETPDWFWGRGRTGWDLWDTLRRCLYLRKKTWDLVHAFDSRPAVIMPALYIKQKSVPLVLDWADWWGRGGTIEERNTGWIIRHLVGSLEEYFEEAFRTNADGTTVISLALQKRAVELGVKQGSILQIPQGSDIDNVYPINRNVCRTILKLPNELPILGYLGVLSKGDAKLLFDTFSLVLEKTPECKLILIGNHKANIPSRQGIIETGYVSQEKLLRYMGACDFMLLPMKDSIANRGRWPSKINDYFAAGKPIIASAVGDVQEIFNNYLIGKSTSDNPEAFASAIFELLSNKVLQEEMGRNARKLAEEQFAWPILAQQLEEHYEKILQRKYS